MINVPRFNSTITQETQWV